MKLSQFIKTGTAMAMLAILAVFMSHSATAQNAGEEIAITSTFAGIARSGFTNGQRNVAQFSWPAGIVIDAAGDLYVSDMLSHRIRKITPQGRVSTLAGQEEGFVDGQGSKARFSKPSGLAIDAEGNLYVVDTNNFSIRKVTPDGKVSTFVGGGAGIDDGQGRSARFNNPSGIVMDAAGNFYVADASNNRIRKITPAGEVSTLAGGERGFADGQGRAALFNNPFSIAIDAEGNLFVADASNNRIRKVTPEGKVSTFAGDGKASFADGWGTNARFYYPQGITIDAAGNFYVTDAGNHRICKITPDGYVSTLAGSEKGFADGKGSAARFYHPSSIAIDAEGNLYVTDSGNHRIRKIEIRRP